MPITALPAAPSRNEPSTFSDKADAFLGALPTFATEANALQTDVNSKQALAAQAVLDAQTAVDQAEAAAEAAQSAVANYKGVWSSSVTYQQGDSVLYSSKYWLSNINSNLNNSPVEGSNWTSVTDNKTYSNATLTSPAITGGTASGLTLNDGYTEEVYVLSGTDINPANASIQTKTLAANTTFTESIADGQSVILGITAGSYTVTWPSVTWVKVGGSGVAPTLTSTGVNWVVLFQVAGTLRGAFLGTA